MNNVQQGIVKWYDDQKGFGFIVNTEGSDVFFHHTALPGENYKKSVCEGDVVEYEEVLHEGKLRTHNVLSVTRSRAQ